MTFSWMTEFCLTVARINFKISGPPGAMGWEELQQFSFGGKVFLLLFSIAEVWQCPLSQRETSTLPAKPEYAFWKCFWWLRDWNGGWRGGMFLANSYENMGYLWILVPTIILIGKEWKKKKKPNQLMDCDCGEIFGSCDQVLRTSKPYPVEKPHSVIYLSGKV